MGWKPTKDQKETFKQARADDSNYTFIKSDGPLRNGCKIKWVGYADGKTYNGTIVNNSYGDKTGQHTFTVELYDLSDQSLQKTKLVKGRNLYNRLLVHDPGNDSAIDKKFLGDKHEND